MVMTENKVEIKTPWEPKTAFPPYWSASTDTKDAAGMAVIITGIAKVYKLSVKG